jgi:hypothetical protein
MLRDGRNDQRYSRLEKQTQKYVTQQVISVTMTPHVDIFVLSAQNTVICSRLCWLVDVGEPKFVTTWPPWSHAVVAHLLRMYLTNLFRLALHVLWTLCSHYRAERHPL